jgi:tRNA modification GTPase
VFGSLNRKRPTTKKRQRFTSPVIVDDTIAAIASAPGGAMRGIVRISGPNTIACIAAIGFDIDTHSLATPTRVSGELRLSDPFGRVPGDLYLWPGRRSYTRQPVAELHTIGAPPVLESVLDRVCALGARPAQPGEFTMRAFLAGRIDLTQAEAVLGAIDAVGQDQLSTALSQMAGGLASPLTQLRESLLRSLSHLEAGLDFVDEDIEFISRDELQKQLEDALRRIRRIGDQMETRGQSTDAPNVVFVGWPNAGKSSLLNSLVGDSAAIVSEVAGTTRDYLTRRVRLDGMSCVLVDTAGVEHVAAEDSLASPSVAAQRHANEQAKQADLSVLCLDASRPLNDWEQAELANTAAGDRLLVWTKADLATDRVPLSCDNEPVVTSSETGQGIGDLRRKIAESLKKGEGDEGSYVATTSIRCRDSLRAAADALDRGAEIVRQDAGEELVAAELRVSLNELAQVVGAVYTDDILERIFSQFCIGK